MKKRSAFAVVQLPPLHSALLRTPTGGRRHLTILVIILFNDKAALSPKQLVGQDSVVMVSGEVDRVEDEEGKSSQDAEEVCLSPD